MGNQYLIDHRSSAVGICKGGSAPVFIDGSCDFVLDDAMTGIALKILIFRQRDGENGRIEDKRVAIFKDADCEDYRVAARRYDEWVSQKGGVSATIKGSDAACQKIMQLYRQERDSAAAALVGKAVCVKDFRCSLPVGKVEEWLTVTLPVRPGMLETDTVYRIGAYNPTSTTFFCDEWKSFVVFPKEPDVEEVYRPYSASLRVRRPIIPGEKYESLDSALRYLNYQDFYSDIHFHSEGGDIEDNPVRICFGLRCTKRPWRNDPTFTIELSHEGKSILRIPASLQQSKYDTMTASCKWFASNGGIPRGKVTACLKAFGKTIARFTFLTTETTRGECRL